MQEIEALIREARLHRDATIHKAKEDFRRTSNELRTIARRLGAKPGKRYRLVIEEPEVLDDSLAGLTTTRAAKAVLEELGPLSEVEITIEIQRRGCRPGADPRAVRNALRQGLKRNLRGWFKRVGEKWGAAYQSG